MAGRTRAYYKMVAAVADAWDSDAGLESTLVALRLLAHRYVALHF